jgi:rhodanese-related sulfurtransferase
VVALFTVGAAWTGEIPTAAAQTAAPKKIDDKISIRPEEAKKLMETKKNLLLIDVRSPAEFKQGTIKGAQNIPFIDILEGRHSLPKDRPILLICSIGGRSYAAGQILLEKGYTDVQNLDGGMADWQKARFPVRFEGIITR